MRDLSHLSDQDLEKIANSNNSRDLSSVSDEQLMKIAGQNNEQRNNNSGNIPDSLIQGIGSLGRGLVQGIANTPIALANLPIMLGNYINKGKAAEAPTIPYFDNGDKGFAHQAGDIIGGLATPVGALNEVKAIGQPIGKALSGIEEGLSGLTAGGKQKSLLDYLSGGKNISENREAIAQAIRNKGLDKLQQAKKMYGDILGKAGDVKLYDQVLAPGEKYLNSPVSNKMAGVDIAEGLDKFNKSPSVENAHNLQSDIRKRVTALYRQKSQFKRDAAKDLDQFRKNLTDKIAQSLERNSPADAKAYKDVTNFYRKEVVPYTTHPIFSKLINGIEEGEKDINLNTLPNLFAKQSGKINKVASDLGNDFKNRLIFNQVGKESANKGNILKGKLGADTLSEALNKAINEQGLARYSSPEISQMQKELQSRAKLQKLLGGLALGSGIGSSGIGLHHYLYDLLGK